MLFHVLTFIITQTLLSRPHDEISSDSSLYNYANKQNISTNHSEVNIGPIGANIRRSPLESSQLRLDMGHRLRLQTESCTLHDKVLAKWVRYREELESNSAGVLLSPRLYYPQGQMSRSLNWSPSDDLHPDLHPTVRGLRKVQGTQQMKRTPRNLAPVKHGTDSHMEYETQDNRNMDKTMNKNDACLKATTQNEAYSGYNQPMEMQLYSSRSLKKSNNGTLLSSPQYRISKKLKNSENMSGFNTYR